jgi:hypothetical protein
MTVTIPLGSGIGTNAKNPGGLGAEPPGTRQPDEPFFGNMPTHGCAV